MAMLVRTVVALLVGATALQSAGLLDHQKLLEAETFWDNRDWGWYKENIPFFECPDPEITTTYYYRWELVTKHLTYGSPQTGYTFTEFIDRPFWSGTYGAISCPAGHQLYEVRWLKDKTIAQDFAQYWFRTPGAQPRRYSCWIADAVWALHLVHSDRRFTSGLLDELVQNYREWEKSHFVPEVGLFWQTGHDDGMEININSRQTKDTVRGAPGYRATHNSYMFADARAIAAIARLEGRDDLSREFTGKASSLKTNLLTKLWDPRRDFFFQMFKQDEERDGFVVKAGTLTYQTGKYAGSPHGRELYNYVPWQFNLPDGGNEAAWKFLMDPNYFYAKFGPTTTERHDPQFQIAQRCCVWSGQSWPYATTQTLLALANILNNYQQQVVTRHEYFRLFQIYTRTHRKNGTPYIAEATNPDTGSWEGHDNYNHSEHYFHSGYVDLLITGLIGLHPREDDTIDVQPLAPADWPYFALNDVSYRGHRLAILWDKTGVRYGRGAGLHLLADGKTIASSARLEKISAKLPTGPAVTSKPRRMNFAVNNEGRYFPKVTASWSAPKFPVGMVNDGNYWYHISPPNRWTCGGSTNAADWCVIDLGIPRQIDKVKLYFLDDGENILPPASYDLDSWDGDKWELIAHQTAPVGRRATVIHFAKRATQKLRARFHHAPGARTGLTEFEAWGDAENPYRPPPQPRDNIALNESGDGFPKALASFTSRYDKVAMANDGVIFARPTPHNRWTSYGSTNTTDWLELDFGAEKSFSRVSLHFYDDAGGVRPPLSYTLQVWTDGHWREIQDQQKSPASPTSAEMNTVMFRKLRASKLRVLFTHAGKARTGLTEFEVWPE
jgi:hypothetical protein